MPPALLTPELLDRIKGLSVIARRIVEGSLHGLHRSNFRGLSVEFAQHREYSPGDELKHLDWKVIGRSDRYVVKQYQQETNLRAILVVDCSGSMGYGGHLAAGEYTGGKGARSTTAAPQAQPGPENEPNQKSEITAGRNSKFDYARTLAAALTYLLIHQGDSVGLVLAADGITDQVDPSAKPSQVLSICHKLEACEPAGVTDLPSVLTHLAAGVSRRGMVILLSDLFDQPDQVLSALGQLHHAGHEVIVFHVLDRQEIEFNLGFGSRGVTVLRDMETGAEFEAEPALIRGLVQAEVARFCQELDTGCRRHGLHLFRCPTDVPAEEALTAYLSYRSRC